MRVAVAVIFTLFVMPSVAFAGTVFLLDGGGWGHGVGMSQWGAEGYARHGYPYRQILAHYYPHTTIGLSSGRNVRVLLAQQQPQVRVGSAAPFLVVDSRGRKLHLPARTVVVGSRFTLRGRRLVPPLRFEPGVQPLTYDLNGYRGDLVVKAKPGGLMVVNELPLDRYLRGVVPWEVPKGWHEATYEAQAVAARSYTLATLHPNADFDLYPDQRSQMYGGIRAERPETNLAVGATAGQVLTFDGSVIPAFYFSSSGGRTAAVQDVWPKAQPVPYLVSVPDPYDSISPRHTWPTEVLSPAQLGARLGISGIQDAEVVLDGSGRASGVRIRTTSGWRSVDATIVRKKLDLGSTDFRLRALNLGAEPLVLFGDRLNVHGWLRGAVGAELQERSVNGWATVGRLHTNSSGHFDVRLAARRSTQLRIAYEGVGGTPVSITVAPRLSLRTAGTHLRVRVVPQLPLQVQRLTRRSWQAVARSTGTFSGVLRPGSYRVTVVGADGFASAISRPVGLRST